jgi:hypothetical protein
VFLWFVVSQLLSFLSMHMFFASSHLKLVQILYLFPSIRLGNVFAILGKFHNMIECWHVASSTVEGPTPTFLVAMLLAFTSTNTPTSTSRTIIISYSKNIWGHHTPSDENIIRWPIHLPLFNLNYIAMAKFVGIVRQWPFQILEQLLPCHKRCEQLWTTHFLNNTQVVKFLNEII